VYELASLDNYLTERTLYRNVGYWKNGATNLDDARLNITRSQLELASKRVAERGMADHIHYQLASAHFDSVSTKQLRQRHGAGVRVSFSDARRFFS
jgi:hypothetical protein